MPVPWLPVPTIQTFMFCLPFLFEFYQKTPIPLIDSNKRSNYCAKKPALSQSGKAATPWTCLLKDFRKGRHTVPKNRQAETKFQLKKAIFSLICYPTGKKQRWFLQIVLFCILMCLNLVTPIFGRSCELSTCRVFGHIQLQKFPYAKITAGANQNAFANLTRA